MEPIDYLKRIRERWRFIAVITAIALIVGSAGGLLVSQKKSAPTYKATTVMIQEGSSQSGSKEQVQRQNNELASTTGTNLRIASSFLVLDTIASAVSKGLDLPEGQKPPGKLEWVYAAESNRLLVSVTAFDPEVARKAADLYAGSLIDYLKESAAQKNAAEAASLKGQIKRLEEEVAALDHKIAKYPGAGQPQQNGGRGGQGGSTTANTGSPADPLITQRGSALVQLSVVSGQLHQVEARIPDSGGIIVLDAATVAKVSPGQARRLLQFPTGALIAALLGLLFAITLTLLRERLDGHLRSKSSIERSFGFPVLADIPLVRLLDENGSLPSQSDVRAADAFRLLRAALNTQPEGHGAHGRTRPSQTILVTSSGPNEGTSTVVAELASTFAQSGQQALILSCDFRSPGVHRFFGLNNDTGLAEALLWTNGDSVLDGCVRPTEVLGVSVVPSGGAVARPSELLALGNLRRAVREAQARADVVLIDTPPILTSDVTFLLGEVQAVLIVARAGTTSQKVASRSADLLRQLGAPVAGVALIGSGVGAMPKTYYERVGWRARVFGIARNLFRPVRWTGKGVMWVSRPIAPVLRRAGRIAAAPVVAVWRALSGLITGDETPAKAKKIRLDAVTPVRARTTNGGNGARHDEKPRSIDLTDDEAGSPSAASGFGRRGFPRLSRRSPD